MNALIYVTLGDLEQAQIAVKAHARIAVTGRVLNQANDSLLVLAALAHAEGDTTTASDLLLAVGQHRHAQLTAYARHLAQRFGVGQEFKARIPARDPDRRATASREATASIETLRQEIARRALVLSHPRPETR